MNRRLKTEPVCRTLFERHEFHGQMVRSISTGQVGVLTAQISWPPKIWGGRRIVEIYVRPCGGGIEWATSIDDIEPASTDSTQVSNPSESESSRG